MTPNLLLVIVDALRADRLGCAGLARAETPFLDSLAARGVRYTRCFTPCGWTLPACASLLTGRLPTDHGLVHHDRRFGAPKVPELLGPGWATAGIANNGNLVPDDVPEEVLESLGFERRPEVWKRFGWQQGFETYRWFHKEDKDGPFAAFAEWLGSRAGDPRPWFAMLHTNLVHDYDHDHPWCLDVERFLGRPLRPELQRFRDGPWVWKEPPGGLALDDLREELLAKYDGCVAEADRRLSAALAPIDLDRTVVVVASDHGEGFDGRRERVHHCGRMHDDLLRVPLVVSFPGGVDDAPAPGGTVDTICSLIDVAPTLLRLAGAHDAARDLPGTDLRALPAGRRIRAEDRGYLYLPPGDAGEPFRRYEYRTHELRLDAEVDWPRKRVRAEIGRQAWEEEYDLELDPLERVNLAPGPQRPLRRPAREEGRLRARLRDLRAGTEEARLVAFREGSFRAFARRAGRRRKLPPVLPRARGPESVAGFEPITFVVAVDDPREFRLHVLSSACYPGPHQWLCVENQGNRAYTSISRLYAEASARARNDLVFFVHQDVYFPPDWEERLFAQLALLERRDPRWGVIGAAGRAPETGAGEPPNVGHWSDPHRYHAPEVPLPAEVQVLDELWLGVRASRGPRFDPALPGFHCYGADLCLAARAAGMRSYALDAPVIHKLFRPDGSLIERAEQSQKIEGRRTDAFRAGFQASADHVAAKWARFRPFRSTCHAWE